MSIEFQISPNEKHGFTVHASISTDKAVTKVKMAEIKHIDDVVGIGDMLMQAFSYGQTDII